VEVAWERRNPPKALKSFCPLVRPVRGTLGQTCFSRSPAGRTGKNLSPFLKTLSDCGNASVGPALARGASPPRCCIPLWLLRSNRGSASGASTTSGHTSGVGLHATDTTHRSSRNSLRNPLRWTSQPGGVVWTPVLPRPRRIPVEFSRHPFRSVFLASAPPGRPDDTNATALQRPCGPPPWHGGKLSYLRHSPRLQRPPALTWAEPGHHPGGCTPSPFSNDLLSNRVTSAAPLLGRGTDDTSRASQPAVVCNRHSPPLCRVGSPVDFEGQNAEAPPYPPSLVPFRFGSVSRFRYRFALRGLCTVELFAFRFFGGYPVLSDRLGVSPPSRLPAAADVERTHHEDFHPDSLLGFGPNPVRRICVGLFPHAHLLSHHGPTLQHPCGAGVAGSFTVAREPGRFRPMR
jgi:hypothetical protein